MTTTTRFIVFGVLVLSSAGVLAQNKAAVAMQCVNQRLSEVEVQSRRNISRDISAHCEPGHNELFKGCVGIENSDVPFSLKPNSGYRLVEGSGSVIRTGGDTPNRTGVSLVSQNADEVIGRAWCNGHGCGGEGAVHVDGQIQAIEERIPTKNDQNEALSYCLNKLLP